MLRPPLEISSANKYPEALGTEAATRLDPIVSGVERIGDASIVMRVVAGDSAARSYVVLFRRANAITHLYALSQLAPLSLDEVLVLARLLAERLR